MTIVIEGVDLIEDFSSFGLPSIKLYRLGELVAIVETGRAKVACSKY